MAEITNFENAYALIIGLSHYHDQRISTLNYTRADAESFYEIITDPKKIGIKKENVKILMDSDATLPNIKGAIVNWLIKKSNDNSTVYIFFAGHGGVEVDHLKREKDGLAKYLLPYDSNFDSLFSSALSSRDFNELLSTLQYKKLIAFIDACHSGGTCGAARDIKITEDPYQELSEGEGRVIIAASKPDQRSYEDAKLGHGIFTHHLIEALSGKADTDNDGLVSIFDVYKYLRDKVPRSAKELADATQEPVLKCENIAKDFTISINPGRIEEIDEEKKREEAVKKLRSFHIDGELSGKQYGRLRKIVKTDFEELEENERVVAKLIDALLSGHINIIAFLEDLEDIWPELKDKSEAITNSIDMKFKLIPTGEFMMGSEKYGDERPVHKVTIDKPFYLGIHPVTQLEWETVMGSNPSNFKGNNLPVETVSWDDAQEFISKLNEKEGTNKYRLPSEAEWEYAARARTTTQYSFGDDESKLGEYAWYSDNSGENTHPVGQKKANPWGLYDIHGNVWEWVQDWYHDDYTGAPTDGIAWESGVSSLRVNRGGSWFREARFCRLALRFNSDPAFRLGYVGFRLLKGL